MSQHDIIELLLATDVYVTPYLDPNQITSGTLSYASAPGKQWCLPDICTLLRRWITAAGTGWISRCATAGPRG